MTDHLCLAQLCAVSYTNSNNTPGFHWEVYDNLIVISGTDNLKDWISNFNFLPIGYYHKAHARVAEAIIDTINLENSDEIIFTGHSSGGSVAEICASWLGATSVSFGAPKFPLPSSDITEAIHIRYSLKYDPISRLRLGCKPRPTIVLPGYGHHILKYIKAIDKLQSY